MKIAKQTMVEWSILMVLLLVLGYTLYAGFLELQKYLGVESDEQVVTTKATPTPTLPELKLNNSHQRYGGTITVDPSNIGKENPFQ